MEQIVPKIQKEVPERLRPAQRAFERAVRNAFLTREAYDPDGKGYAYWKAIEDAEAASKLSDQSPTGP